MIFIVQWLSETNIQAAIIGPFITSVIGVLGFLYHRTNERKICLSELIQEIEELATEHWCSSGADNNNHFRAIKIQSKLSTLGWKINQNDEVHRKALIEYRQAVTGGDFDLPDRRLIPFEDPRIALITEKARCLRRSLKIKKHH